MQYFEKNIYFGFQIDMEQYYEHFVPNSCQLVTGSLNSSLSKFPHCYFQIFAIGPTHSGPQVMFTNAVVDLWFVVEDGDTHPQEAVADLRGGGCF